jgi:hypothetical protein
MTKLQKAFFLGALVGSVTAYAVSIPSSQQSPLASSAYVDGGPGPRPLDLPSAGTTSGS